MQAFWIKERPGYLTLVSLDIGKAFDTVDHALLTRKLVNLFGFDRSSYKLICSYLEICTQCMKVSGFISSPLAINKGVPQGSILGLLLFNLMVNDMLDSNDFAYSYADDTVILAEGPTQEVSQQLASAQFECLNVWYSSNGLSLCANKSRFIVFSRNKVDPSTIMLNNAEISSQNNLKLLGVILDSRLSLKTHIDTMVTKTYQSLYLLRKIRVLLNIEDAKLIYCSIIRPKLEYCSTLFMFINKSSSNRIEACQNKAIRIIIRAPNIFSVSDGRRLLNVYTLSSRRALFYRNLVGKVASGTAAAALYEHVYSGQQSMSLGLRSKCRVVLPSINTNFGKSLFKYNAIKILKGESELLNEPSFTVT